MSTRALSPKEQKQVIELLPTQRDKVLFQLGIASGFRISELLSLQLSQVTQYGCVRTAITVLKANTKGKVASRSVPISKKVQQMLQLYVNSLPDNQVWLFQSVKGGKLGRVQAWNIQKTAFIRARLEGNVSTHSMRKSFARKIYELSGKDLVATQKALNHTSMNSTVSYLAVGSEEVNDLILRSQR